MWKIVSAFVHQPSVFGKDKFKSVSPQFLQSIDFTSISKNYIDFLVDSNDNTSTKPTTNLLARLNMFYFNSANRL